MDISQLQPFSAWDDCHSVSSLNELFNNNKSKLIIDKSCNELCGLAFDPVYLASFKDVTLYPQQGIIRTRDNFCITETVELSIANSYNKQIHRIAGYSDRNCKIIDKTVLLLWNWASRNYYHWHANCLPCLQLLHDLDIFKTTLILTPELTDWQRDSLELIGIKDSQLHIADAISPINVTNAIYVSFLKNQNGLFPSIIKSTMQNIRHRAISANEIILTDEKLYLTRFDSGNRICLNEGELIDRLRTKNYRIVTLQNWPYREQIKLFANAKEIVAPHGAGLVNLGFCKDTKLHELIPVNKSGKLFERLALHIGIDYSSTKYELMDKTDLNWRINDMDSLVSWL